MIHTASSEKGHTDRLISDQCGPLCQRAVPDTLGGSPNCRFNRAKHRKNRMIWHSLQGVFAKRQYATRLAKGGSMTDWQPINSAKKDGSEILAFIPGFGMGQMVLYWTDGYWRATANGMGLKIEPTHWMPLPGAPSDE